ncbi:hypothetical protein H8E88_25430 [candidate division KSB1 bacterium]|nr:hypothetical protein [candidate division KSB1 bacterium]MBL7095539.1 hypothetical protein [candidate division KSB1 bacterium]
MSNLNQKEKINIYKNLFKSRTDIFAARWEKADKSASGYSPVCLNEYIGRIQRGENEEKTIYDYRDKKIEYLEKQFKNRLRYYKKNFGYVQN